MDMLQLICADSSDVSRRFATVSANAKRCLLKMEVQPFGSMFCVVSTFSRCSSWAVLVEEAFPSSLPGSK